MILNNQKNANLNYEEAIYKEQELTEYKGNPLIEALPPVYSISEAYEQMLKKPHYDEQERYLSEEIRYHMLYRLQSFFQPVTKHLDLERRISRLIRSGYIYRNPVSLNETKFLRGFSTPTSSSSFTLMGFSGIGKSTGVESVLALYPQVILHKHPVNRFQVVWLKLNCPHDGSIKALCMDFFVKIDELLGTSYFKKFGNPRNNIASLVIQMGRLARIHCIGALIIDEIQHLLTAKDKGSEKMMNFFVTLINEIGIPVLLIGTMRAKSILQQDFRQARRGSGLGDMVWEQMEYDDDWKMIIEEMWQYQWTRNIVSLTDELRETIYEESQGIVDIAVKLYTLAQSRAIETGNEIISPNLIRKVGKEDLKLVQPMLNALKSGLISEISKYEDITPMDLSSYLEQHKSKIDLRATLQNKKEEQKKKQEQFEISEMEKSISALLSLGIDPKIAEATVRKILKENKLINSTEILVKALELIKEKNESKSKVNKPRKTTNELATVIKKGKKEKNSAYKALLDEGYIKPFLEDFIS